MSAPRKKLGFNATWSMAVGGMVGGGIFSVLGVVIERAGELAWLSFALAGLVALITGLAYARLAKRFGESGGAFTFLRDMHEASFAGALSWVLIAGYVLTLSVYAFAFGHYLSYVFNGDPAVSRLLGVVVIIVLTMVNLRGAGEAAWIEIVTVWGKLAILVAIASAGIFGPNPAVSPVQEASVGVMGAVIAAGAVFMAYEGFQLLTYDYDDIENPARTLPAAVIAAVLTVIGVYILVTFGVAGLVAPDVIRESGEVVIAIAGKAAFGTAGLVLATVAAVFSTASAINATMFATARLMERVAEDGELPRFFAAENDEGTPYRAVGVIGGAGAALSAVGSLSGLVEAASLTFLFTFAVVNVLAALQPGKMRAVFALGALGAGASAVLLAVRMFHERPGALVLLGALAAVAVFVRPLVVRGS